MCGLAGESKPEQGERVSAWGRGLVAEMGDKLHTGGL